jgi:allantoinase
MGHWSQCRYRYSSIQQRPHFSWPEGKRLAVYVALNVERYVLGGEMIEELLPAGPQPDILNYAWCDYGNRVGVWRLHELFEQAGIPITLLVNSALYNVAPEIVTAFRSRGDEIACHGRTNSERLVGLQEDVERRLITEATETMLAQEGKHPGGWLSPWIAETPNTPDLLKEAGYRYLLDWCSDDQPFWMATRSGPLLSVPYPQEINDSSTVVGRYAGAAEFADMIVDQFEEMLHQSKDQPLVMGIALHTHVSGQPFRLRHLRRALEHITANSEHIWLTHAGTIADHFSSIVPPDSL